MSTHTYEHVNASLITKISIYGAQAAFLPFIESIYYGLHYKQFLGKILFKK